MEFKKNKHGYSPSVKSIQLISSYAGFIPNTRINLTRHFSTGSSSRDK